ncbi:Uma2 family endonuclease [Microlunatus speluncae]|uniref:Uma2 family endonuclease n=1 Tax=Microlunatus speluncae TaxID=2594267 RepID=UPI001266642D|nr:Uma2 family endonuclease [Microlunatus speluncae]
MTAPATPIGLPHGRALTRDDLAAMPDDGHRYELIDGTLVVTPAPSWEHQGVSSELNSILKAACPPELRVFYAPMDVVLSKKTVLQPDLLVARRADLAARDLPKVPLLAVEILSPSTRHIDLGLKRSRYEAAGCPSYWVIDPGAPSITAWELRGGRYELAGEAIGNETLRLTTPYLVEVKPAKLLDG